MTVTAPPGSETILSLRSVTKSFGSQRALDSVDLDIRSGEIHAVVGQNGCGKSTLVKLLAGYHSPDPGSVGTVAGASFELGSVTAAKDAGLRFVHQDLGLIDDLSVAENFFIESDRGWVSPITKKDERVRTAQAIEDFGYDIDPRVLVGDLTAAERTAVAIVRALRGEKPPALLILDEPTASLPGPDAQLLFAALRRLTRAGGSVLFISHHLDEVLGLAGTVTVLRDGRRITTTSIDDLSHDRLVELMLGRALTPRAQYEAATATADPDRVPRLSVRDVRGDGLLGVDLDVYPGEVLGIAGLTGSGRENIAGAIAGQTFRWGSVTVDGEPIRPSDPADSLAHGLAFAPAERRRDALLSTATLRENLTIANLRSVSRRGRLSPRLERKDSEKWMETLDVRPPMQDRVIDQFSGGNQQKVVLGRLLRTEPKVLVLDEPTQGVDIGAKDTIHGLIVDAASEGAAVIICSTDVEELVQVATRVLVFRRGLPGAELTGQDLNVERIEEEQLLAADVPPHNETADVAFQKGITHA
ncbi:sugar ABC transporter ATP-binding protein [Rhodococcus pyridinivorans]|uniref:sugar ABC transporter ATP-binding protein n=1 Tax=Rhodococcus pyridinivorans TaxID=103816 RepID=UPI0039B487B0